MLSIDKFQNDIAQVLANQYLSPALRDSVKYNNVYDIRFVIPLLDETIAECLMELYPDSFRKIVETPKKNYSGFYLSKWVGRFATPYESGETS
jgi:hypothetical protein